MLDRFFHAGQFLHQTFLVPGAIGIGLAQFVITLLHFMHHVGQVLQVVGARITLDGMHVAEQLGNRGAICLRVLADDALVLADKFGRSLDKLMEFFLTDRQNFPNHFQSAPLFVRFGRQLAQLGDVTHTQHQTHDGVAIVGNGRPAQIENLDPAVRHAFLDFIHQQMLIEFEVHRVFTQTCLAGGIDLRQGVGAQIGVRKDKIHQATPGNVAGLKDGFQISGILGMNHGLMIYGPMIRRPMIRRPLNHSQNTLLHVLQHRLDIGCFLFEQQRVFLNFRYHAVERHRRMPQFIHPAHRHPAREILAGGNLAHHRLHPAQGTDNLAIKQCTDQGQEDDRDPGDAGNRDGGGREGAVQHSNSLVFFAVFLDPQGIDDLLELVAILRHIGKQIGLRQLILARGFHRCRIVDRREIVLQTILGLCHQTHLRVAGGALGLEGQRRLQRRFFCFQFFLRLRHQVGVRRIHQFHRSQLYVFNLRHQIGRGQRAWHHTLRHLPDFDRTAAGLINGISADGQQGDEHQDDQQRNAMTDSHVCKPSLQTSVSDPR